MLGLLLAKRSADVLVLAGHEDFEREFRGEDSQHWHPPAVAGGAVAPFVAPVPVT